MNRELLEQCVAAVLLALRRVDLSPVEQLQIVELTAERLRIMEAVDETALLQIAGMS